jgi:Cof subfamily protein (haloacid dehalogenase superfamily)
MGIFQGWLLATDIDGTLLDQKGRISLENKRAITHFRKEGGIFILASGRSPGSMQRFYEELELDTPIICSNGAGIYDYKTDTYPYECMMGRRAADFIDYILANLPDCGVEIYKGNQIYFVHVNEHVLHHQKSERLPWLFSHHRLVDFPWSKILLAMDPALMPACRACIQGSPFRDDFAYVQSSRHFYEALHLDASKGTALQELSKITGIPKDHMISMGDNENDAKMLVYAGYSFAVANATPEAKAAAKFETHHHNDSAVAAVIKQMEKSIVNSGGSHHADF